MNKSMNNVLKLITLLFITCNLDAMNKRGKKTRAALKHVIKKTQPQKKQPKQQIIPQQIAAEIYGPGAPTDNAIINNTRAHSYILATGDVSSPEIQILISALKPEPQAALKEVIKRGQELRKLKKQQKRKTEGKVSIEQLALAQKEFAQAIQKMDAFTVLGYKLS